MRLHSLESTALLSSQHLLTMPRYSRIPAILRTAVHSHLKKPPKPGAPRLWNGKRRIKGSKGLTPQQYAFYRRNPESEDWRTQASPDVVEFIDANTHNPADPDGLPLRQTLLPEEKAALLRSPVQFFSRPHRVPSSFRKQVYFPDFAVTLLRKPTDSPYFASFLVPLWFNKLDIKSYLQELYNVPIVHVRSWVVQRHLQRKAHPNPRKEGAWYRPQSEKRMKVQLVEPFEWPAEIQDFAECVPSPKSFIYANGTNTVQIR